MARTRNAGKSAAPSTSTQPATGHQWPVHHLTQEELTKACDAFETTLKATRKPRALRGSKQPPVKERCLMCGEYTAARRSDLIRHLERHRQRRKYACGWPGCTHRTNQKANLDRHYRGHTGEKITCNAILRPATTKSAAWICGFAHTDNPRVSNHRTTHHKNCPKAKDTVGCIIIPWDKSTKSSIFPTEQLADGADADMDEDDSCDPSDGPGPSRRTTRAKTSRNQRNTSADSGFASNAEENPSALPPSPPAETQGTDEVERSSNELTAESNGIAAAAVPTAATASPLRVTRAAARRQRDASSDTPPENIIPVDRPSRPATRSTTRSQRKTRTPAVLAPAHRKQTRQGPSHSAPDVAQDAVGLDMPMNVAQEVEAPAHLDEAPPTWPPPPTSSPLALPPLEERFASYRARYAPYFPAAVRMYPPTPVTSATPCVYDQYPQVQYHSQFLDPSVEPRREVPMLLPAVWDEKSDDEN